MNRFDVINSIKESSTCMLELSYTKRTNTRYELRVKPGGKTFVLITYDDGKKGFDVYYPEKSNESGILFDNFEKY